MKLGEQLSKASDQIVDLILKTPDVEQKKALREELTKILDLTGKLVEINVDQNTEVYKQAGMALADANESLMNAIEEIEDVAETIHKIAKAIDLAAKVAGTAI
ncbi:MAG: hypothetical protein ACU833_14395 [Gammaproteobacteria bacterium]